jgi:hypothetical protein
MSSLLDYLGSLIFGGAMLLITLNANDNAAENLSVYNGDMLVQEMLVQTVHLLEGEFRNMGLGVPESDPSVIAADTSAITFLYDIDRNGTPDNVRYRLGVPAELPGTKNDLDRPLYRSVNGGSSSCIGVVTAFRLRYLTRGGETLLAPVDASRLSEIHSVEITVEVQNPYAIQGRAEQSGGRDALYSSSLWQQTRLASQNSRR